MHRLPFGIRKDRGSKCGEKISADVCGPISVQSLGGARYFLLIKDDFSKFRAVYFLNHKSEVADKSEIYFSEARTRGHAVEELLTDGGTEFVNKETSKMFKKYGVFHRVTMPYTPQQN